MGKYKKTRQEKVIADLRRKFNTTGNALGSLPKVKQPNPASVNPSTIDANQYLMGDLSKTAFLTGLIILIEFFLFVLLKNRVFVLPAISF